MIFEVTKCKEINFNSLEIPQDPYCIYLNLLWEIKEGGGICRGILRDLTNFLNKITNTSLSLMILAVRITSLPLPRAFILALPTISSGADVEFSYPSGPHREQRFHHFSQKYTRLGEIKKKGHSRTIPSTSTRIRWRFSVIP